MRMKTRTRKRVSATLLAFVMAVSAAGIAPAETGGGGIEHTHDGACGYKAEVPCGHTTHDENCGYKEATEGSACSHEHDENCYRQVTNCLHIHTDECYGDVSDASPSDAAEPENCPHICSEEDGCITKELDCPHIHDGQCGYVPASDGQPCKHEQGEHDGICGYVSAAPCNVQAGSRQMRGILQKTNEQPSAETLLTDAKCTVVSETANTQPDVVNWIKTSWLPGINRLGAVLESDYGAGISDLQITTSTDLFVPAVNGTGENQEGTAGQFKFSVVLPGGDGGGGTPQLTVQKTCTITPNPYTPSHIGVTGMALPPATVGVDYSFSLDSLLADGFSKELVNWTLAPDTALPGGLSFTTGNGMISGTPTTAGPYRLSGIKANAVEDVYQANEFTFTLIVNEAGQYPTPIISASGETVDLIDGVVHVNEGNMVHLEANLSQNAPDYSLQWQKKQEGEDAFTSLADAAAKGLDINAGDYPNNTQFRCVATYAGNIERESAPVTLRYRPSGVSATVTGNATTENGTPLYGREIEILDENSNVIGSGVIDENGEYSITDVPEGEYSIGISGVSGQNSFVSVANGNASGDTDFAVPVGNIPGATSQLVSTAEGGTGTIEFVSSGNTAAGSTVGVSPHSPTLNDILYVAEAAYPGSEANVAEELEMYDVSISNNKLTVSGNGISHTFEKVGEIVDIGVRDGHGDPIKFIVREIGKTNVVLVQSGTNLNFHIDSKGKTLHIYESMYNMLDENTLISINEAQYYRKYKLEDTNVTECFIYLPDRQKPAGVYYTDNYGFTKVIFNKDCDPDSVKQQQQQQKHKDYLALVNAGKGNFFNMSGAFSYDINLTGGSSGSTGPMGTIGISGIENADKSIFIHRGSSGYQEGTLNKNGDGFFMTVRETSPFMIFTFTEANMEIPVTTITTNSGDSGNGGSSSDGDSSGSSTYNPDILRGTWIRTDSGIWMFRMTSGAYARSRWGLVDGLWYYFDNEGKMLTGWQFLNNRWYYLCTEETSKLAAGRKEGAMLTGWYYDPAYQGWFYLDASGAMLTGWKEIGGRWYYFYENGIMAADTEVDGYKLGPDGAWKV